MKSLEKWKEKLRNEQNHLLSSLHVPLDTQNPPIKEGEILISLDVQYVEEDAFVAIDMLSYPAHPISVYLYKGVCSVPYFPGYFAFREGPVLVEAIEAFVKKTSIEPHLILVDGHGTAHPRKMGIASWLGIKLGKASMGVAKDPLLKQEYTLAGEKGSNCKVWLNDEVVGFVLRSREEVKPIFVSAGNKIGQLDALKVARKLVGDYRQIEPLRRADQAARAFAKNAPLEGSILLE